MKINSTTVLLFVLLFQVNLAFAQPKSEDTSNKNNLLKSETFNGLKFRSIGPALTSGRVADIAVRYALGQLA